MLRSRPLWLVGALALAVCELTAHARIVRGVPDLGDYRAAAKALRAEFKPRDLIVAAPAWSDPIVRQIVGDRIDLAMAGASDTAPFERLWALSIRGARPAQAPAGPAELTRTFGAVTLMRWSLGPSPVVSDLVQRLAEAQVSRAERACVWRSNPPARGGGLGRGVLPPEARFECAGRGPLWLAPVVLEDLSLAPRYCAYHPPGGREPVNVRFDDTPLGERLVVYAGLYYEDERMRRGAPVTLSVSLDGAPLGTLVHKDGDGWKRMVFPMPAGRDRGSLMLTVTSRENARRNLCWVARTERGPERVQ